MERLSIDLTGPHPRSKRGNVFICTVVDVFSKWLEIFAIRNKEALTVTRVLVEKVFCRMGTPLSILSDRGGEVDGQVIREVCQLLHIDKLRTSAYHPACNAQIERQHRTLNTVLGKVVSDHQTDWDEMLPYVAAALRASPSESTGYSANYLMFGREVNTPADIVYGVVEPQTETSYDDFVESVVTVCRRLTMLSGKTCILLLTVTSGTMTCRLNRSRLRLESLCTISTLGAFRGDPKNGLENTQVHLW